ncbi:hypothetical protein Bbelb_261690 [Branchiostoma belcheri]|nr:hypothetical protein Bbelb_261690 [Branchiostoma belcheri]
MIIEDIEAIWEMGYLQLKHLPFITVTNDTELGCVNCPRSRAQGLADVRTDLSHGMCQISQHPLGLLSEAKSTRKHYLTRFDFSQYLHGIPPENNHQEISTTARSHVIHHITFDGLTANRIIIDDDATKPVMVSISQLYDYRQGFFGNV